MKKIILILVLFFALTTQAWATIYYVDATDGDDAKAGTSEANAWKTISKVNSEMGNFNPGDSILFQRGETWNLNSGGEASSLYVLVGTDGTSGNEITFGAYGAGNDPIFDGTSVSSGFALIEIEGNDYLIFEEMRLTNCYKSCMMMTMTAGAQDYSTHITVSNMEMDHVGSGYMCIECENRTSQGDTNNILITGSTFHDGNHDAIRMNNGVTDSIIEYSTFYNWQHNAIDSYIDGGASPHNLRITIRYNKIYNCQQGLYLPGGSDGFIIGNIMYDFEDLGEYGYCTGIKLEPGNHGTGPDNMMIRNNIVSGVDCGGASNGLWLVTTTGAYVYNNAFYDNAQSCELAESTGMTFDNNIFYGNDGQGHANCAAYGSDPKFTNPGNEDFTLQSDSPAIDAGTDLGNGLNYGILPGSTFGAGGTVTMVDPDNYGLGWEDGPFVFSPIITITATDSAASETGPDTGTFRIARTGPTTGNLVVNFTLGGTAGAADYVEDLSGGTVTILDGNAFVDQTITPVDDSDVEGQETLTMTIAADSYAIGSPSQANITIQDNESEEGSYGQVIFGAGTGSITRDPAGTGKIQRQ